MRLETLSHGEWRRLLRWLDTSGLALYFLDRITELGLSAMLAPAVLARLQQNLADNTERTNSMIAESLTIQRQFQEAGLSYILLKGFTLWPESVSNLALRSQLDLDFLVAESCASQARQILEDNGYYLQAISGRSWEFKSTEGRTGSLKDLYKAGLTRSVELHLELDTRTTSANHSVLTHGQVRHIHGLATPVASSVDLFLGQGLHLYKHVCSEFVRAAHLIEFRRHILARYNDQQFWNQLHERTSHDANACLKLGTVILLISRVMGSFAPAALTRWTVDPVPAAVRRWIELYARRMALAGFPGGKLYLILQAELEACGLPARRSLRQALVPNRLPPAIAQSVAGEDLAGRWMRYRRQLHFILFRFRFHAVHGTQYLCESIRWRNYKNGLSH